VVFCCVRLGVELVEARADEAEVVAIVGVDVLAFVDMLVLAVALGLKKAATALATTLPKSSGLNEAI
jgi:DNA-binding ferritin-like protein (Dps family)